MKKLLLIALLFVIAGNVEAQSFTINNNTSCVVWFIINAGLPGTCTNAYASNYATINPYSTINYSSPSAISWGGGATPSSVKYLIFLPSDKNGSCSTGGPGVGEPCLGAPSSDSYVPTCTSCAPSVNYTWSNSSGNITVNIN